jgi:hypothetical protein
MLHFYIRLAVFKKSSRKMVPTGHPGVRQTDRQQRSSSVERYRFGCGSQYSTKCRIIGQIPCFPRVSRANLRPQVEEGRNTRGEQHTQM